MDGKVRHDGVIYGRNNESCIAKTVDFCSKHIDDSRLKGFLQTLWVPTIEKYRTNILQGIELLGEALENFKSKQI